MKQATLDLLQCPFCGGPLHIADSPKTLGESGDLMHGVLYCDCNHYAVVDGVAYLREGDLVGQAIQCLEAGDPAAARRLLLGIDEEQEARLSAANTFMEALAVFDTGPEAHYFQHRFADPRFFTSDALLRALTGPDSALPQGGVAIDLCGGAGHLTRSIHRTGRFSQVIVADYFFYKVWLSSKFVAPDCDAICLDCDRGLPFRREAFDLLLCSGAFEYVWSRRVLADEIKRLISLQGIALLTHLKNLLCVTFNPGMPLDPAGYRRLFADWPNQMFRESTMFEQAVAGGPLDLAVGESDAALEDEAGLILLATRSPTQFRSYRIADRKSLVDDVIVLNPLYQQRGDSLALEFPTEEYEAEFGECRAYLPTDINLPADVADALRSGVQDHPGFPLLASRRIVIELPNRYC